RLAAADRTEGVDVALLRLAVDQLPQLPGAATGQGVLGLQAAAQADHVGGRVRALDPGPARVVLPLLLQGFDLSGAFVAHVRSPRAGAVRGPCAWMRVDGCGKRGLRGARTPAG